MNATRIRVLKDEAFDMLYHAGAPESGGMLVTADERYFISGKPPKTS